MLDQGDVSSVHLAWLSEDKKSLQNILEREKLNFLIKKKANKGKNTLVLQRNTFIDTKVLLRFSLGHMIRTDFYHNHRRIL